MGIGIAGGFGGGERTGGGGSLEGDAFAGGDVPAIGSDFDELALGIGEIEEDLFGSGEGAAGIDAVGDANAAGVGSRAAWASR